MTCLERTDLTTAQKVQCAAQALVRQAHGAITALGIEFNLSRPTVYQAAARAEAVLEQHFSQGAIEPVTVTIDHAQLRRAAVALRVVAPNSIRAIETLLPLLYPGQRVSYGTLQSWLVEAQANAAQFNAEVPLSGCKAAALDEVFSQGDPVLAGIDLDSGYLFSLAVRAHRSGEDWAAVLGEAKTQGLDLSVVVKDAAKGIAAGVREVFPEAEQRDDCFHVCYEVGKVRQRLERRAYATIEREQELAQQLRRTRVKHRVQRLRLKHQLVWAQRRCRQAIADFDAFETAQTQAQAAMSWVDLETEQWRTGAQVREGIERAAETIRQINQPGCAKLATYLTNRAPGLALYAEALDTQLSALSRHYGEQAISTACVIIQLIDDLQQHRRPWQREQQGQQLIVACRRFNQLLGTAAKPVLERVQQLWQQRHRASSAIEGFNASVRPYLYVHKRATQGFLDLYRAYFNLRTRRWGRHKNTSAYQVLTGDAVEDWLSVLGFPLSPTAH